MELSSQNWRQRYDITSFLLSTSLCFITFAIFVSSNVFSLGSTDDTCKDLPRTDSSINGFWVKAPPSGGSAPNLHQTVRFTTLPVWLQCSITASYFFFFELIFFNNFYHVGQILPAKLRSNGNYNPEGVWRSLLILVILWNQRISRNGRGKVFTWNYNVPKFTNDPPQHLLGALVLVITLEQ